MKITRRNILIAGLFTVGGGALATRLFHPSAQGIKLTNPLDNEFTLSAIRVRLLGQASLMAGSLAALRVIVTNQTSGNSVPADVELHLTSPDGKKTETFRTRTDANGSLVEGFKVPKWEPGEHELTVKITSGEGSETLKQKVTLTGGARLMLTSDKPVYQPGQVIHLRSLALDAGDGSAFGEKEIVFEVEDGKGNKVYKKRDKLSKFGIAGVDFQLADEVNMGSYTLRAISGKEQMEKRVRVERYVLPKYKIEIKPDKSFYLPGEILTGKIIADYFFGKPVEGAQVSLDISTADIGVSKLTTLKGKTDGKGEFQFKYPLPDHFIGQALMQGKGVLGLKAVLKDTADHLQEQNHSVSVCSSLVQIVIVPESARPLPGVENLCSILVTSPDGEPMKGATVQFSLNGNQGPKNAQTLTTDDSGIAVARYTPQSGVQGWDRIEASADKDGIKAFKNHSFFQTDTKDGVILRTDKSIVRAGEKLQLTGICTGKSGTLYVDVINRKQTAMTLAQPVKDGRAELTLNITPEMTGTLEIHGYRILQNENIVRDVRTIIVLPANDLTIKAELNQKEYRPGQEAKVNFRVTDVSQKPVACAIGLAIVDESVFALSELQPGLERIYFTLEKELMEPKYEIHGLTPTGLIQEAQRSPITEDHQRKAGLLLASFERNTEYTLDADSYTDKFVEIETKTLKEIATKSQKLRAAFQSFRSDNGAEFTKQDSFLELISWGYLSADDLKDPWGTDYRIETGLGADYQYFQMISAGPDREFNTWDDIGDPKVFSMRSPKLQLKSNRQAMENRQGVMEFEAKGGMAFAAPERAMAAPMAMKMAKTENLKDMHFEKKRMRSEVSDKADSSVAPSVAQPAAPRVREYFPETMLWNPQLITDADGYANLTIPIADSITTWRMSMSASSQSGQLGSDTVPIRVFQEFFVDLDLPVALTQNDQLRIPVSVYNYLSAAQKVTLTLEELPWFKLEGGAEQSIELGPNEVKVVYYPISASVIGVHQLTVTARGSSLSDAIKREIAVRPHGRETLAVINGNLDRRAEHVVKTPSNAVVGGNSLFLKLYPGTFSTLVEGLEGVLQMPNGCFEQTSSSTYPNVLILDYLKSVKKVKPEIQLKAEQYINVGYQRLVTFECKSGGFSWFGNEPAHQILTAYGLLEFADMSKVYEIDGALIKRVQSWLLQKQLHDGSWLETGHGIEEGIITRQTGALRSTAYVAWALAESGADASALQRGIEYVKRHLNEAKDAYTLAVILNLLSKVEKESDSTQQVAERLIDLAKQEGEKAFWKSDSQTFTGANGSGADIESTGLAVFALAKWGRNGGFLKKALTYLTLARDPHGSWNTTQGTVWAMKALLFASANGSAESGNVVVKANGHEVGKFELTKEDSDVVRQIDLSSHLTQGEAKIEMSFDSKSSLNYQLVSRCYLPWDQGIHLLAEEGPLSLKVEYDKTTLRVNDLAGVKVTIRNRSSSNAEMPLIDVGIPPGFEAVPDGLTSAVESKEISKYSLTGRQIILYLTRLKAGETVTIRYKVRAKYSLHAQTPKSSAYPYYNPEKVTHSAPQEILVHA